MRLILKTVAGHFQVYWIAVEKNSIIGWFSGDWLRQELKISNRFQFEAHFTFPQDGNFHHSYKYKNKDHETFINVYCNKVKIKSIVKGKKILSEKTRQEFSHNILEHLVPQYKADTLDLVKQFHFPTINFNVFNGGFKISKTDIPIEEDQIKDSDLVVDISQMNDFSLNISAGIIPMKVISTVLEPSIYYKHHLLSNDRYLELGCTISPLK